MFQEIMLQKIGILREWIFIVNKTNVKLKILISICFLSYL